MFVASIFFSELWSILQVGNGALIPLEVCVVPPGQIMKRQVPHELTSRVLEFATKVPSERLASIRKGLGVLAYGQSEYVRVRGTKRGYDVCAEHFHSNSV